MPIPRILNQFAVATLIAGQVACSTPAQDNEPSKSTVPLVTLPTLPPLSEAARVDALAFARLESAEIRKTMLLALVATDLISDFAKEGNVDTDLCAKINDPKSKAIPVELKEAYDASVSAEVLFGGETNAGKITRLKVAQELKEKMEENIRVTQAACNIRYSA